MTLPANMSRAEVMASLRRPRVLMAMLAIGLLAAVGIGIWLFDPPPRGIRIASGPVGSAEYRFAQEYQEILGREGVKVEVVATGGVLHNLRLLRDPSSGIDVGLVDGASVADGDSKKLMSLGTLYYRPVWIFHRGSLPPLGKPWPRLRVAVGSEGDDPDDLARQMLVESNPGAESLVVTSYHRDSVDDALLRGDADVVAIAAPWESEAVQRLLLSDSVNLRDFPRAAARVALRPYLTRLLLPEGVADLPRNLPDSDIQLVATRVSMGAKKGMHPALQYLLLDAMAEVHGKAGVFEKAGQFPAAEPDGVALSKVAISYHKSGVPYLQRHLPFWVAALLTQVALLLIPLVGIAYPVLSGIPALYENLVRHRVSRLYGQLKLMEIDMAEGKVEDPDAMLAELDQLDHRARRLPTSAAYIGMVYGLRGHINFVRDRLLRSMQGLASRSGTS